MEFNPEGLDKWCETSTFEVRAERVAAYAEATNDPIRAHRAGEIAPPVFACVPTFDSLLPAALEIMPPELLGRVLHGEQDFRFHRPILPGQTLSCRAKAVGYHDNSSGSTATVYAETRGAAGELVNEQWVTFFFRRHEIGESLGVQGEPHEFDQTLLELEPVAEVVQHVDSDQTFRYSPASGDPMPIHLDEDAARLAGLPGIIAHGLCTMAFTSWAVLTELADGQVERLRRLAVRFAKPVFPGQDITTRLWSTGGGRFAYQTWAGDALVIRDGLAELS
ncbi:MaoC/PaaZ C-terminal domain-containing protein [Kutzneria albida]|uniref:Dehydratase n=1 Tax=Kutzneria albida DSM 43870 TaxID=1449976 RepID=W5W419_9PSEU|nr:MaoC/PaaZ C-terminal domain-containing protein [Kutzneria albida]AHH95530.1 hypothetical protein KALB_2161 [Kutzneria albida DSM 43870]